MSYSSLNWQDGDAELRTFSVASAKSGTVLRIELHVSDPMRLGMLLQDIASIRQRQARAKRQLVDMERECVAATRAARKARPAPLAAQPAPALITYRGGE